MSNPVVLPFELDIPKEDLMLLSCDEIEKICGQLVREESASDLDKAMKEYFKDRVEKENQV